MIRTEAGGLVSKFLSVALVHTLSNQFDTDTITPGTSERCRITEAEWRAVPQEFVRVALSRETISEFKKLGGMKFLQQKVAQLVKIAKAEEEIQLDLVSELILFEIGNNSYKFNWEDEDGRRHYYYEPVDFPERQELLDALMVEEEDEDDAWYNEDLKAEFESFYSLMLSGEEDVFWDLDFTFLSEDGVVNGIGKLYLILSDYDRDWHERPWRDIGEEVPAAVTEILDQIDKAAEQCGGFEAMRRNIMEYAQNSDKMKKKA